MDLVAEPEQVVRAAVIGSTASSTGAPTGFSEMVDIWPLWPGYVVGSQHAVALDQPAALAHEQRTLAQDSR